MSGENSEQRTANSEQRTANSEQRTANSEQRTANSSRAVNAPKAQSSKQAKTDKWLERQRLMLSRLGRDGKITTNITGSAQLHSWLMGFAAGVKLKAPQHQAQTIRQMHREAAAA